jgi:transposase, IS5 family
MGPGSSNFRLAKRFSQKDLNFRRLLETHGLAQQIIDRVNAHPMCKAQSLHVGTIVDATIIAAPSSIKK